MKATDEQISSAYQATGSVWLTAKQLGMCGQSVHERLTRLGIGKRINVFTDADKDILRSHYAAYANSGKAKDLAAQMGRTPQFLCRMARELGLTRQDRKRPYIATWKYLPTDAAEVIWSDFKASKLGLGAYCKKHEYDDLGFSKRMRELFPDEYEHVIELKQPKTSKYRRGREFEYRTRDYLKRQGYFVMRSPASRSPLDLMAVSHGIVLMVQCKLSSVLPVGEWNDLFDLAASVGAKPILAVPDIKRGRGIRMFEMTDRKDGTKRPQPMVPFHV